MAVPSYTPIAVPQPKASLILPGGGARGAYQVGALKAVAEIVPEQQTPFPIIVGISVGAVNAAMLACYAQSFAAGVGHLEKLWSELHCRDVYKTDFLTMIRTGFRWLLSLTFGGIGAANPKSFLDNQPLEELLNRVLDFKRIDEALENRALSAVAITAASYTIESAVTFFQTNGDLADWHRARRDGIPCKINIDHLMASIALPFIFPPRRVGASYFGDGSLRMTAPLSPAIHLGTDRILVLGIRDKEPDTLPLPDPNRVPSFGVIGGHLLDILFSDNLDADIERLERINRTVSQFQQGTNKTGLRPIRILMIQPSQDFREIARRHAHRLPWTVKSLFTGLGANARNSHLPSFLLFEGPFCRELIELGYQDAMARRQDILEFFA